MKIPKRIASVLINSLKGGVVPRIGLPYITVGREVEIQALLHDVSMQKVALLFVLLWGNTAAEKVFYYKRFAIMSWIKILL